MASDKEPLPQRAPYKAHDDELREANKRGIRPATDAEEDAVAHDKEPRSRFLRRR